MAGHGSKLQGFEVSGFKHKAESEAMVFKAWWYVCVRDLRGMT